MNCSTHPDASAVAYCRTCGKALCADCRRAAAGTVYCAEHEPVAPAAPSMTAGPPPAHSVPALAFILGFIPGVGAIYNGQYAKGLVHAVIFGLMVSILSTDSAPGVEPLVGILLAVFVLYMAFEAYHTAHRRNMGERVDEFSSLFHPVRGRSSAGPLAMIALGTVFLLNTLGILEIHRIVRFWPVALIAAGIVMLYNRISEAGSAASSVQPNREANRERQ